MGALEVEADEFPWEAVIDCIEDRALTAFLGAGISAPPLPDAATLAAKLIEARKALYPFRSTGLMEVAQYWATLEGQSAPKRQVRKVFEAIAQPDFRAPDQPHRLLASLPIAVYLTTNYDLYMEQALVANHRMPHKEICRWNSGLRLRGREVVHEEATSEHPLVYHLHGHIEDQESLVLTEDDYLDFMVNTRRFDDAANPDLRVIPPIVDEAIALNSLLFVGYSLKDWNLRVLLRTLVESADKSARRLSVSVQLEPDDRTVVELGRHAAMRYLDKYFDGLRIRVYWGTMQNFLLELTRRWADHVSDGQ